MKLSLQISLLLFILINVAFLQQLGSCSDPVGFGCEFGSGIPPQSAIDRVFSQLVAKAPSNNFATASYGSGSSAVYGLLQCRGDVPSSVCTQCAKDAVAQAKTICGTTNGWANKVWYDFCFLRYDTKNFFGKFDSGGVIGGIVSYRALNMVNDTAMFEKKLKGVMDSVRNQALKPNSGGLGRDKVKLSPFNDLYGLAQCTEDLPPAECAKCLADAYTNFEDHGIVREYGNYCKDYQGCRVLSNECYVRYEIYPFYFPLYSSPKPTPVAHVYRKKHQ